MYEFFLGNNRHEIKNRWEELAPDEFVYLFNLLESFNRGELTVGDVRVKMVLRLMKISKIKIRTVEEENLVSENIYRLQQHLDFIFRIVYEDKRFAALPEYLKHELSRREPENSGCPEERLAIRFERYYEVDSVFCKNLIPCIDGIHGYKMENQNGILVTDFTAARFCDAVALSDRFIQTNDIKLLDTLVSILYFEGKYDPNLAIERAVCFSELSKNFKAAIFFNLQCVLAFLYNKTKYKILFGRNRKKDKVKLYNSGLAGSLITMGKRFGGVEMVGNGGLIDFLEMMLDSLIEYVQELDAMGKSVVEIAEKTKLDVITIKNVL
nr:hypothetical protein [uncultured Butyricimonas sp.]